MSNASIPQAARGPWAQDEHERFLDGLLLFPDGPWKAVADVVGTRTVRQVQTHAQKYQEKAARRLRDLRQAEPSLPVQHEMKSICEALQRHRVPLTPRSAELQRRATDRLGLLEREDTTQRGTRWVSSDGDGNSSLGNEMPPLDDCLDFLIDALLASSSTGSESE